MTAETGSRDIRDEWQASFRHAAGQLTSHFFHVLRDEARLVGWRSGNPARVHVPPRQTGQAGEWVPIGPGAELVAWAPEGSDRLALVRIDGADGCSLWRLRCEEPARLREGARLVARFAEERSGSPRDLWFEVVPS